MSPPGRPLKQPELGRRVAITVRVPESIRDALVELARREGRSQADILIDLISAALRRRK